MKNLISIQEWMPFREILEKGVLKLKDTTYVKILKVIPINYNLKSELEKKSILNSYKTFLKICNFDIQILIQSNKENLNHINSKINNQIKKEKNKKIEEISKKYINYIKSINYEHKSTAKSFFIIIKAVNKNEENYIEELEEKSLKIKETLSRCGNRVEEIETKEELKEILYSFFNRRLNEKR